MKNVIAKNKHVSYSGDVVEIEYNNISRYHRSRIRNAVADLSSYEVIPEVYQIHGDFDDETLTITMEKISMFNNFSNTSSLTISEIKSQIETKVHTMHALGWAHGDLHIMNIGFVDKEVFFIDFDTMFEIKKNILTPESWVRDWMTAGFDISIHDVMDFVKYDLEI